MLDSSYHMTFELLKILFLAWKHHDFATSYAANVTKSVNH